MMMLQRNRSRENSHDLKELVVDTPQSQRKKKSQRKEVSKYDTNFQENILKQNK